MYFSKVYIYKTNTKKPWDYLTKHTPKVFDSKKFRWACNKFFILHPNLEVTQEEIEHHIKNCPELGEINEGRFCNYSDKCEDATKKWKHTSEWYHIYPSTKLNAYDVKLLLRIIGIRMLHFIT